MTFVEQLDSETVSFRRQMIWVGAEYAAKGLADMVAADNRHEAGQYETCRRSASTRSYPSTSDCIFAPVGTAFQLTFSDYRLPNHPNLS